MREGLDGQIELDALRRIWMPISPFPYLERMRDKKLLLVYARYDLTFPVDALEDAGQRVPPARRGASRSRCCPCGHYSTGVTPFKWIDGLILCRFLSRSLSLCQLPPSRLKPSHRHWRLELETGLTLTET